MANRVIAVVIDQKYNEDSYYKAYGIYMVEKLAANRYGQHRTHLNGK
jgi:hypothetical protein